MKDNYLGFPGVVAGYIKLFKIRPGLQ